jgi:protein involved in polysaccharide export with SLBB domain
MNPRLRLVLACLALAAALWPAMGEAQERSAAPVPTSHPGHPALRAGDRLLLQVQNDPALSDTFTVSSAGNIRLPKLGDVPVSDVPRDQLNAYITTVLERYYRRPVVRVTPLIRVGIIGEVARPGFYAVPTDAVFADALMTSGGPTRDAAMRDLRIERGGTRLIAGPSLRTAMAQGATLDALAVEAGDVVVVPRQQAHDAETFVRILAMAVTIPVAVYGLTRVR